MSSSAASSKPPSPFGPIATLAETAASFVSSFELAPDGVHGAEEAGRVAGGEELLGVGSLARSAHLYRRPGVEVEAVVFASNVAVAAPAGGMGNCSVESFHESLVHHETTLSAAS